MREVVNTDRAGGILYAQQEKIPWWQSPRFPLVPIYSYRPRDEWNESGFNFSWLFLRVWSMMNPDLSITVGIDGRGARVKLFLPYLIILFQIPFPLALEIWSQRHLWRRGTRDIYSDRKE